MAKPHERASVPGPAFIRQLARLTDADVPHSNRALSERLSQWIDWNRAIVLSRALDGQPAPEAPGPLFDSAQAQACAQARAALASAIQQDPALAPAPVDQTAAESAEQTSDVPDYAPLRRRYTEHQRAMQATTGRLRGRLREMLARQSPGMARLAEVDAVMELTLSPREHTLLAAVPGLLGTHFEHQRQAAADASPATDAPATAAWLSLFRRDMRQVLLAELDVRFQPIEGLLAALHSR